MTALETWVRPGATAPWVDTRGASAFTPFAYYGINYLYKIVCLDSSGFAVVSNTLNPVGVSIDESWNNTMSGSTQALSVYNEGSLPVTAGAVITAGQWVISDVNGNALPVVESVSTGRTTGMIGIALSNSLSTADANGDYGLVTIKIR
jgi:Uncharacterized conserved protein (DUF2190)